MLGVQLRNFNAVNFQGNSLKQRNSVSLHSQPTMDTINFKGNVKTAQVFKAITKSSTCIGFILSNMEDKNVVKQVQQSIQKILGSEDFKNLEKVIRESEAYKEYVRVNKIVLESPEYNSLMTASKKAFEEGDTDTRHSLDFQLESIEEQYGYDKAWKNLDKKIKKEANLHTQNSRVLQDYSHFVRNLALNKNYKYWLGIKNLINSVVKMNMDFPHYPY